MSLFLCFPAGLHGLGDVHVHEMNNRTRRAIMHFASVDWIFMRLKISDWSLARVVLLIECHCSGHNIFASLVLWRVLIHDHLCRFWAKVHLARECSVKPSCHKKGTLTYTDKKPFRFLQMCFSSLALSRFIVIQLLYPYPFNCFVLS